MNFSRFIRAFALVCFAVTLQASGPARQALVSPDKVPEGLAKSDWALIREAYEAGRHAFQPTASGWQARNPGQHWLTTFDRRGFVAQPEGAAWQWGLELKSYGLDGWERSISGVPKVQAEGQCLSYQWDASLNEWFVNDRRGLEHGFTVSRRPEGSAELPLAVTLGVRGGLRPAIAADALGVAFQDDGGATVVTYAGLKVWDADGRALDSRFVAAGDCVRLLVEAGGARFPITIDPIAQQAYLKASNTEAGDSFGSSVAVSGNMVVVGAPGEDSIIDGNQNDNSYVSAGAAYVFVRSGTTWTQIANLKAPNSGQFDNFGYSVGVSGDIVVVGAPGEDSSITGVGNGGLNDESAISSGAAYIFLRVGNTWYPTPTYLKASNTGQFDNFGASVAVSGNTVIVGAYGEDSSSTGVNGNQADNSASSSGAAYVFVLDRNTWTQQAYLKASNTLSGDNLGKSVSISGDTVVVGATGKLSGAGAAYVFVRSGTTWAQQSYLRASNTEVNDNFGISVAVSGDTVAVGASLEDSNATGVNGNTADNTASASGAVYVFARSGTTWAQQAYLKASNTGVGDSFGASVAVSGDTLVAGAPNEGSSATGLNGNQGDNTANSAGAVYVFGRSGTTWTQLTYLKASNTDASDNFGMSVAMTADALIVGASNEASNATGVNGNQTANSASGAGAAYVFTIPAPSPDIEVSQGGTALADGTGSVDFSTVTTGTNPQTFIVTNPGPGNLANLVLTKDGANSSDFIVGALSGTSIPAGSGNVTFTVTFSPASSGVKSATLHLASNVSGAKNPFDIALTGRRLSPTDDTDGDGLNDAAEFNWAALGFNWQVSQPAMVNTLFANAASAGLYTSSQVQTLNVSTPLLTKNQTTGKFTLTIGVQRTPNLANTPFTDFLFGAPETTTTINGAGKLEFEFPASGNAEFFRLQVQ